MSPPAGEPGRQEDVDLAAVVGLSAAERLAWALLEEGVNPEQFDLADLDDRATGWVGLPPIDGRGLIDVWWDDLAVGVLGLCVGTADDMRAAADELEVSAFEAATVSLLGPRRLSRYWPRRAVSVFVS